MTLLPEVAGGEGVVPVGLYCGAGWTGVPVGTVWEDAELDDWFEEDGGGLLLLGFGDEVFLFP